jgi:hypothetical protein
MHTAILMLFTLLWSMPLMAQGTDIKLRPELEALHAKWFKAFDSGDGATMDQMEMDNLTLVMPGGFIWPKTTARAESQQKRDSQTERTLSDVSVRRFGDTLSSRAFSPPNPEKRTPRKRRIWDCTEVECFKVNPKARVFSIRYRGYSALPARPCGGSPSTALVACCHTRRRDCP